MFKSNQIKSLLLSHHHSTSALVSEILMSVLQTVQKNNRQFTYGQTVQKNNRQFTYGQTVQKNNKQFTYGQTVQKTALEHLQCSRQCKKNNNSNLHMDRQCKKATAIYIWTVHIYRLYRRQLRLGYLTSPLQDTLSLVQTHLRGKTRHLPREIWIYFYLNDLTK